MASRKGKEKRRGPPLGTGHFFIVIEKITVVFKNTQLVFARNTFPFHLFISSLWDPRCIFYSTKGLFKAENEDGGSST